MPRYRRNPKIVRCRSDALGLSAKTNESLGFTQRDALNLRQGVGQAQGAKTTNQFVSAGARIWFACSKHNHRNRLSRFDPVTLAQPPKVPISKSARMPCTTLRMLTDPRSDQTNCQAMIWQPVKTRRRQACCRKCRAACTPPFKLSVDTKSPAHLLRRCTFSLRRRARHSLCTE